MALDIRQSTQAGPHQGRDSKTFLIVQCKCLSLEIFYLRTISSLYFLYPRGVREAKVSHFTGRKLHINNYEVTCSMSQIKQVKGKSKNRTQSFEIIT